MKEGQILHCTGYTQVPGAKVGLFTFLRLDFKKNVLSKSKVLFPKGEILFIEEIQALYKPCDLWKGKKYKLVITNTLYLKVDIAKVMHTFTELLSINKQNSYTLKCVE